MEAAGNTAVRASRNKAAFNNKTVFARDLESLVKGQAVKLCNEKHTKGSPRWFGPFTITKVLDNNIYIIADHDAVEYPRPVNGNSLRPVALRSLIVNDMWAAPPAIAQREKRANAKVARELGRIPGPPFISFYRARRIPGPPFISFYRASNTNPGSRILPQGCSATLLYKSLNGSVKSHLALTLGPPPSGSGTAPV
ncbi:hypothetical protein PTTG_00250 [Puccinia triticina 1-1 BBBD Race 1]|uniref:Uncharacterized protein n=1 Tax=Puccinia triticina (isolate 1-1 / race 1 (BBBD)) TaxID=630390 RepID=A0A0C4EHN4_PUCT1|nr:hypothetical protein PTTG_00250 [Puccinia triticina 1-1 BBBD Race 1]